MLFFPSLSSSPIHHSPHLQKLCDFENTAKAYPVASDVGSVLPSMCVAMVHLVALFCWKLSPHWLSLQPPWWVQGTLTDSSLPCWLGGFSLVAINMGAL